MANKIERVITPLPATEEEVTPLKLVFFCRNCEKVVPAKQTRKRFVFACPLCGKAEIAFGTAISVQNFYHLSEDDMIPAVPTGPMPIVPMPFVQVPLKPRHFGKPPTSNKPFVKKAPTGHKPFAKASGAPKPFRPAMRPTHPVKAPLPAVKVSPSTQG